MKLFHRVSAVALGVCASALLSGCALETTAPPVQEQGAVLQGRVLGGNQPVVGARIYLLQANTTGYGGVGIAATSANASKSLLLGTYTDTSGGATNGFHYVTTDGNGSFTITGDYTCTANSQVYLYALGGNTGSGTNSASGFLSILGNCPAAGNFLSTVPSLSVTEVTTVAAAYAFAGFATDAVHVSSSATALAATGIANAFANFGTLVNVASGSAYAVNPRNTSGTVPQSELNTLGNILSSCVNSTDAAPGNCTSLFSLVKSAGSSGTLATDTATEAIYIAQHPGVAVGSLFNLQAAAAAYQPSLSKAPNDFTVGLVYTANGLNTPVEVAVDAKGYAWVASQGNFTTTGYMGALSGFTNLGAVVANSPTLSDSTNHLYFPQGLAIDQSGNIWVVNQTSSSASTPYLSKFTSAGADSASYTGNSMYISNGIAIDPVGDILVTNTGSNGSSNLSRFTPSGTPASNSPLVLANSVGATGIAVAASGYLYPIDGDSNGYDVNIHRVLDTGTGSNAAIATSSNLLGLAAVDVAGNVWIADQNGSRVIEVNSAGVAVAGSPFAASLTPYAVAIDGSSNVWLGGNHNYLAELNGAGTQLSPASGGYGMGSFSSSANIFSIAIDGSGDVWSTDYRSNQMVELIGAATPVVTPISANLVSPYGSASVNKP